MEAARYRADRCAVIGGPIYCGPKAPTGFETNWIPTVPGKNWFAYFRFYEPTKAYFDRVWPLPDFEQV